MSRLLRCLWVLWSFCVVSVAFAAGQDGACDVSIEDETGTPLFTVASADATSPAAQQQPTSAEGKASGQDALCLKKPLHWSERPKFGPGLFVILTRFIQFETQEGKTYQAKAFLVEILPKQAEWPASVPPEVQEKRRQVPARMLCLGFQIEADEHFQPDYSVPSKYVTKRPEPCMYRVRLGTVDCDVRVVAETADRQK